MTNSNRQDVNGPYVCIALRLSVIKKSVAGGRKAAL